MIINRSFNDFKFRHRDKKNQIIYTSQKVKSDNDLKKYVLDSLAMMKIILELEKYYEIKD